MEIVASLTEQTTAATDLMLGIQTFVLAGFLNRYAALDAWRTRLWQCLLLLSGAVAFAGTIAHGLVMPESVYAGLWIPMLLCLGQVVALVVLVALYDLKGQGAAKKSLPWLIALGVAFFAVTRIPGSSFLFFIVYEIVGMLFGLGTYGYLGAKGRLDGALIIAFGLLLQIVAAGIQAAGPLEVHFIWVFDHNGLFHIVGSIAIFVMVFGVVKGFSSGKQR